MAGNANSGRRPRPIEPTRNADSMPPLGETPEEIRRAMEWVWQRAASNEIDTKVADVLIKAARTALAAAKERDAAAELERWERAVADAKAVEAAGIAREAAQRLHNGED